MSEASVDNVLNSLHHLCRICLHQMGEINIFGELMLDGTISLCLDILVLPNDGGPQSICSDCKDKLDGIMIFRLIGERSKRQLQLFLGRFEDYYNHVEVSNFESVECQPDVTTFAIHTNHDTSNNVMDMRDLQGCPSVPDGSKEPESEQIEDELLENETEGRLSPPLVKQGIESEIISPVRPNSSPLVPNLKISVRTDLISHENDSSNVATSLNHDLPSTSGVNGDTLLLEAIKGNSGEMPEHKFVVPKTGVIRNRKAYQSNGLDIVKKEEEAGSSKNIKMRSRRTSLEPSPPPICEICQKQFASRTSLYLHNRLHTQEKAHICPQCKKIFSSSTELSRHIRVHTGEKPYTCEICEKSFTQKVSLRKHQEKLHPVQKFEEKLVKPSVGDLKIGLVNQQDFKAGDYVGGPPNQPDFNAGVYIGGLMNQPGSSVGGHTVSSLNPPNFRANGNLSGLVNQQDFNAGECIGNLVNQPTSTAGESVSDLVNQPAIGAGEYANSSVNQTMVSDNGSRSVNQSDFTVHEQGCGTVNQSIKRENSFYQSDVVSNYFT